MAGDADRKSSSKLPSLTSKHTQFIRPRKTVDDEPPLNLRIMHGRRHFNIVLKIADNEHGDRITMRHLAEMITCETGIRPRDQQFYFKNLTWRNPDMGPWSPALRDMGFKNGDKIQLVTFHQPYPDWEEMNTLESLEKEVNKADGNLRRLFYNLQGVHEGFVQGNNQLMALTCLKRSFEDLKEKLMEKLKALNSINFDHRNVLGQAKRRELVDHAQRQIDKCTDVSTTIFHKLAQAHYASNVGRVFPRDQRLFPSQNKWRNSLIL
ncbi:unnamed protein product [Lymnaea stagnalis]|uniref:Ubiquitin-like domain-containing protein n=1 Tax=Lymnaea stagnalis TaxID=6523 RepID=A0AAV2I1E8_LYMST